MGNYYGFHGSRQQQQPQCPGGQIYTIRSGDTIYRLALRYEISVDSILAANPGLDPDSLQVGRRICIPVPACPGGQLYTIKAGDTIYRIAQSFEMSVDALLAANPGIDPDRLYIGQKICIPGEEPEPEFCEGGEIYVIRAGDTIYRLAQQYSVSVDEIIAANPGINPNRLQIGQQICIPRSSVECPGRVYVVKPGDNLYRLAQQWNVTLSAILDANPQITDPDNLSVGQNICVPPEAD